MSTEYSKIVASESPEPEDGLALYLTRYCGTGEDRYRMQVSISPFSTSHVKLDRRGVLLLIKFLEESLK